MSDFDFFKPYLFNPNNFDDFSSKLIDIIKNYDSINVKSIQTRIRKSIHGKKPLKYCLK